MPHPLPSTQDGKQDSPLWSLSGVGGVLVSFHCCDRTCDIKNLHEEGQFQRIHSRVPGSTDSRSGKDEVLGSGKVKQRLFTSQWTENMEPGREQE